MFKANLRYLREYYKLTQTELAKKTGISRSTITAYELGTRLPSYENLEALADVFNVDLARLVGEAGNPIIVQLSNDLTDNEVAEVVNYILYLKSKRGDAN